MTCDHDIITANREGVAAGSVECTCRECGHVWTEPDAPNNGELDSVAFADRLASAMDALRYGTPH